MRTRGAIIRQAPGKYEVTDLEVDDPRQGELRVRMVASGMCHSDDHIATGDLPVFTYPICGGHEGGGVVESVGPHTSGFEPGDKVLFSFLPACGRCRWCATGHQNVCDLGATILYGSRWDDTTSYRMHLADGTPVGQALGSPRSPSTPRSPPPQRSRSRRTRRWRPRACSAAGSGPAGDRRSAPATSAPATP